MSVMARISHRTVPNRSGMIMPRSSSSMIWKSHLLISTHICLMTALSRCYRNCHRLRAWSATNNRALHRLLLEGVPVEYKLPTADGERDDEIHNDHAFLVDFDQPGNNQFVAINQFTVSGITQPRRPDVICFINGLPFAVLELKSPSDENADIWDAFNQLQTYKDEISDLFIFNEALVVSDGFTARVGSLTANQERFMPWRTIKHEDDKPQLTWQLETMVRGFFDRELFLDYIRYFVHQHGTFSYNP